MYMCITLRMMGEAVAGFVLLKECLLEPLPLTEKTPPQYGRRI